MESSDKSRFSFHITSEPDTTSVKQPQTAGAKESIALPLRLLVVANLAPHARPEWSAGSHVVSVDKYTYDDLLRSFAPRLTLEVPNTISEAPKLLDVDLTFASLKAFHPAQVAKQVPALAQLAAIRGLVRQVQRGQIDLETFKAKLDEAGVDTDWASQLYQTLTAPPPPEPKRSSSKPKPKSDDALDRLLGMVSTGDGEDEAKEEDEAASGPAGLADALIGALAGAPDGKPRVEQSVAAVLLEDLDDLLARQVDAIITHPDFRRLEAAWRGLKLLVDRLDARRGVRLDVLAAPKAALSEAVYHQVLLPEHDAEAGDHVPLAALVLDHLFDHTQDDIDLLADLAETAASLQVPCIAGVGADFFGLASPTGLSRLPVVWQHLDGPAYIPWQKLRQNPDARHLALAVPPVLLRPAYGDQHPVEAFSYTETGQLWGSGALAVAVAMGQSFVQTGWPTHLAGTAQHRLENLPTWKSPAGQTPLAALLAEEKQGELSDAGFVVLSGRPDRDVIYLTHAPTVARSQRFDEAEANEEAQAHASLACRLFTARVAQFLLRFQNDLQPGTDLVDAEVELKQRLRALLHGTGAAVPDAAVHIQLVPEAGTDAYDVLAVRLQPPPSVLDYPVRLVLGVQVARAH